MGRPPSRPAKLRDGFYIEVKNKGESSGIKIRRESKEELQQAFKEYAISKNIDVLGELRNGKWYDIELED